MPGLENLQIMPTSGEPPTPAVQAQQHRLEHTLEDELVNGAGDAGEAARHAGALDRVGVGRTPLERLGLEPGPVLDILPTAEAGGFPSQAGLQRNFRPELRGLMLHRAANAALHVLGGAPARFR